MPLYMIIGKFYFFTDFEPVQYDEFGRVPLQFSAIAIGILERAIELAHVCEQPYVAPEHVLLSIVQERRPDQKGASGRELVGSLVQNFLTIEEFEDRVLNKRAGHLNNILKTKFQENMSIQFSEITRRNMRKKAAQNFYSILVLQKACAVNIDQADSYADIMVTKGPKFDSAVL